MLWFWALWECAQFCVQSKLKTPLGKALDTFVAVETSIKNFYNLDYSSASSSNVSRDPFKEFSRVNLLLQFVEYLEKLIYNGYEGTAVSLQPASKSVKIFFRTNKSTCNEWFKRVRFYLISICMRTGHHELVIRHSWEYILNSLQYNLVTTEFDQVLVMIVKSLIKVKSWQSIIGLSNWLSAQSSLKQKNFDWIKTAALEAQGKLETACEEYKRNVRQTLSSNQQESVLPQSSLLAGIKFQNEKILECYFQIHNWKEYLDWHAEYKKSLADKHESEQLRAQMESKIDLNYIKALSSFESNDLEACQASLKEADGFGSESARDLFANVDEIELMTIKEIFKSVAAKKCNVVFSTVLNQKLTSSILRVLDVDEMSAWTNERLIFSLLSQLSLSKDNQSN